MIICIDVGNTNVKYAIFDKDDLKFSFRVATDFKKTSDEFGAQLTGMLAANGVGVHHGTVWQFCAGRKSRYLYSGRRIYPCGRVG